MNLWSLYLLKITIIVILKPKIANLLIFILPMCEKTLNCAHSINLWDRSKWFIGQNHLNRLLCICIKSERLRFMRVHVQIFMISTQKLVHRLLSMRSKCIGSRIARLNDRSASACKCLRVHRAKPRINELLWMHSLSIFVCVLSSAYLKSKAIHA